MICCDVWKVRPSALHPTLYGSDFENSTAPYSPLHPPAAHLPAAETPPLHCAALPTPHRPVPATPRRAVCAAPAARAHLHDAGGVCSGAEAQPPPALYHQAWRWLQA